LECGFTAWSKDPKVLGIAAFAHMCRKGNPVSELESPKRELLEKEQGSNIYLFKRR
jgi:hypothetical protein